MASLAPLSGIEQQYERPLSTHGTFWVTLIIIDDGVMVYTVLAIVHVYHVRCGQATSSS